MRVLQFFALTCRHPQKEAPGADHPLGIDYVHTLVRPVDLRAGEILAALEDELGIRHRPLQGMQEGDRSPAVYLACEAAMQIRPPVGI
ncbi:hypothetical protein ASZ90_010160 [hydrocarbon metagenome]|uniref:Uncharacterized protein n=1 Tax=hydrocarbon metagenome TaxID=938273 RepID=A0A0W8FGT9_9ZZZZ|nr:hypothetical protein [Methanomicrobiaceae archaeon]